MVQTNERVVSKLVDMRDQTMEIRINSFIDKKFMKRRVRFCLGIILH